MSLLAQSARLREGWAMGLSVLRARGCRGHAAQLLRPAQPLDASLCRVLGLPS